MTGPDARVVTVGAPQTFRQQVARTLEIEPDDVAWMPSVTSIEESLLAGREWARVPRRESKLNRDGGAEAGRGIHDCSDARKRG